jgi:hypothetical protein
MFDEPSTYISSVETRSQLSMDFGFLDLIGNPPEFVFKPNKKDEPMLVPSDVEAVSIGEGLLGNIRRFDSLGSRPR